MPEFDAIVIGTGQAGPVARPSPGRRRQRVAIIERHRFGGTCVNTGCTPTKTLVASAYAAHLARRAAEYGVVDRQADHRRHEEGQGAQGLRVWASPTAASSAACRNNPIITVYRATHASPRRARYPSAARR